MAVRDRWKQPVIDYMIERTRYENRPMNDLMHLQVSDADDFTFDIDKDSIYRGCWLEAILNDGTKIVESVSMHGDKMSELREAVYQRGYDDAHSDSLGY